VKNLLGLVLAAFFAIASVKAAHAQCTPAAPPSTINTVCDLQNIGFNAASLAGDYVLGNDIDASDTVNWNNGTGFVPIGNCANSYFTGSINGQGYKISNLTSSYPIAIGTLNIGLFACIGSTGLVRDLGLTSINYSALYTGAIVVGGIAAQSYSGAIINSYVTGSVTAQGAQYGSHVGGLVGFSDATNIVDSYFSGKIANNSDSGGETGGLTGFNGGTISRSHALGSVTGPAAGVHTTGGLVGTNQGIITLSYAINKVVGSYATGGLVGAQFFGSIKDSYAEGAVNGGPGFFYPGWLPGAGGLIGYAASGTVTQTYAIGSVVAGPSTPTGGLVGSNSAATVTYGYYDTQATGQTTSAGGVGVITAQVQSGLPSGFDSSVWSASPGNTYPYLVVPLSQLSPSSYNLSTAPGVTAFQNEPCTCLADVFATIARTVGEIHDDASLLQTTVDYFWDGSRCSTPTGGADWTQNPNPTLLSEVSFVGPSDRSSTSPIFTNSIDVLIRGQTIFDWMGSGQLAILKLAAPSSSGKHFVLATGADLTNRLIFASDAWTGTRIAIYKQAGSMSDGQIVQIMDPVDGIFYSYTDLICTEEASLGQGCGRSYTPLSNNVLNDFNTILPTTPSGRPSYLALETFSAKANVTGQRETGWVEVIIK